MLWDKVVVIFFSPVAWFYCHCYRDTRPVRQLLLRLHCLCSGSWIYLGLIGTGPSRKVDEERQVAVLVQIVHEFLLHVHRLPCSSGAHEQKGSET